MKKILKYTAAIAAGVLAIGCAPEIQQVSQSSLPQASEIETVVDIDQPTNTVTFSIKNTGMVPVWDFGETVIDGKVNTKTYTGNNVSVVVNESGEHTIYVRAYNASGLSVGSKPVTFTMENYVPYGGHSGWNPEESSNLWNSAAPTMSFWYAPGWNQIADPGFKADGDWNYVVTCPSATTDQWQAQVHFLNLGISTSASKSYDFQVILESNASFNGATIKLHKSGNDGVYYFTDRHELEAGKEFIYQESNFAGQDIDDLDLVFDFGGCPDNTEVIIKDIIIREHK